VEAIGAVVKSWEYEKWTPWASKWPANCNDCLAQSPPDLSTTPRWQFAMMLFCDYHHDKRTGYDIIDRLTRIHNAVVTVKAKLNKLEDSLRKEIA
jgi:hypothetical protein